jgi:mannose/fructose/N-acetylgalactosamine-specific phosphotransferase system component IID
MKSLKQKFSSRKFIVCLTGILTGICVAISGNVVEGVSTVLVSMITYLIAEGYIDAKALDVGNNVIDEVKENLKEE